MTGMELIRLIRLEKAENSKCNVGDRGGTEEKTGTIRNLQKRPEIKNVAKLLI